MKTRRKLYGLPLVLLFNHINGNLSKDLHSSARNCLILPNFLHLFRSSYYFLFDKSFDVISSCIRKAFGSLKTIDLAFQRFYYFLFLKIHLNCWFRQDNFTNKELEEMIILITRQLLYVEKVKLSFIEYYFFFYFFEIGF